MRLISVTVLGTALIGAGMLAPATGEATATGHGGLSVEPDVAAPGQHVQVSVPGCRVRGAASPAFAGRAAGGSATVSADAEPGTYTVVARCAGRKVAGRLTVAGRLSWPTLLPAGG
ncbi:hypothetical protein HUT06_39740 [Actinomadura sp. NAK00032]|uniref:hypothetical protein n=1 Tax=Actinomadura sp. NAK00032 TaxID=2742128 RepID=UPI001591F6A6|nr:hypothetical protein [Actinomadura sp. NAK00032]QKW39409.1 hypothetical protein HUT06_39740 [Actinomadura sp. NAK00032]